MELTDGLGADVAFEAVGVPQTYRRGNYGYTEVRIAVRLLDQMVSRLIRGGSS